MCLTKREGRQEDLLGRLGKLAPIKKPNLQDQGSNVQKENWQNMLELASFVIVTKV